MAKVTFQDVEGFETIGTAGGATVTTRSSGASRDPIPSILEDATVQTVFEVVDARSLQPSQSTARSGAVPVLTAHVEPDDDAEYLMIVRSASGAMTFHAATDDGTGGLSFRAPMPLSSNETVRRGLFDGLIDWATDKIIDEIIVRVRDAVTEKAIDGAEAAIWSLLGRKTGLFQLDAGADEITMTPVSGKMKASENGRALLLLHGTFSTTNGSFGSLIQGDFFAEAKRIYGDKIYGFEHFSVSASVEDNANALLKKLPTRGITCDVITQSRGGLILRTLVERSGDLANGNRFTLGRAAMVACPNEGTPLATPGRWQETAGWLANILDLFPPNAVTSNAAMILHWINWFAKFAVTNAEGLASMDERGAQIKTLNQPPAPKIDAYSALASNFAPSNTLLAKAIDLGFDAFFQGANDLVVPTAGAFRIDNALASIPADKIGIYGPGGNIPSGETQVHHMNAFGRPETQTFLLNAITDQPQNLPSFDPSVPFPTGSETRNTQMSAASSVSSAEAAQVALTSTTTARLPTQAPGWLIAEQPNSSIFELIVLDPDRVRDMMLDQVDSLEPDQPEDEPETTPFLYASYDGARVMVPFRFKKVHVPPDTGNSVVDAHLNFRVKEIRERWGEIFGYDRRVKAAVSGDHTKALDERELRLFGELLFETLLPGPVRRLYDVARARETDKLFLTFASMIPWVFDLPWEFARDGDRGTYLATEDVNFIRNVQTPTPEEQIGSTDKLRLLVVTAVPIDQFAVSAAEETKKLLTELRALEAAGLISIDLLPNASATQMHQAIALGEFDVVHFIGHGYWNHKTGESGLIMENELQRSSPLGGRALCEIFSQRGIRLVFLNACDTGRSRQLEGGAQASLTGVAQDLFSRGAPNVIANQFPVDDRAAVAFAQSIYHYLSRGKTVAQAMREARIAANYAKGGHNLDWAIPVAYARNPEYRLVNKSDN